MRNLKNRIRNSVSFLKKFNKRGTLVGLTVFQHIFFHKHGKNSAVAQKNCVFQKYTKIGLCRTKTGTFTKLKTLKIILCDQLFPGNS